MKDMSHIEHATKISVPILTSKMAKIKSDLGSVKTELDRDDFEEYDPFKSIISPFYEKSMKEYSDVENQFEETMKILEETTRFYGEDPADCSCETFFGTLPNLFQKI